MPTGLGNKHPLLLNTLRMGTFCLSGQPLSPPSDPVRGRLSRLSEEVVKVKLPARCGL